MTRGTGTLQWNTISFFLHQVAVDDDELDTVEWACFKPCALPLLTGLLRAF